MPKEMAHSHLGMVTDGRYVYVVTGQYGPQCRGPTARNFVLDTETKEWHDLPPLPVPRYKQCCIQALLYLYGHALPLILILLLKFGYLVCCMLSRKNKYCFEPLFVSFFIPNLLFRYTPATQLWRGRLHVMGGSKEDRHEPGLEHWSIAVKDGKALENEWRSEVPIPRGGPHRSITPPPHDFYCCHFCWKVMLLYT